VELLILFLWSFAAATVLPLSSEIPLAMTVWHSKGWVVPVAVATAGNYLGACTTYGLARAAIARIPAGRDARLRHASGLIARHGPPALLLSWIPLIGDVLVALAGAARMPFALFSIWTVLGKAARYVVVGWLAARP
jgi:membrane protein YqaA with SNARE-associated domain